MHKRSELGGRNCVANFPILAGAVVLSAALTTSVDTYAQQETQANITSYDFRKNARAIEITPVRASTNISVIKNPSANGSYTYVYSLQYRLPGVDRPIVQVGPASGQAQSVTTTTQTVPGFTSTNTVKLEEQTTYYWSKLARDYAVKKIWVNLPDWPGQIPLNGNGVQPSVLTLSNFNTACYPTAYGTPACMRAWLHNGPQTYMKEGGKAAEGNGARNFNAKYIEDIVHEFGHYATGFTFGHMAFIEAMVPAVVDAALNDRAKLAFQEAGAMIFAELVLHDARYSILKDTRVSNLGGHQSWPPSSKEEHEIAVPITQAFTEALWGKSAKSGITVDWGTNQSTANDTMAKAFVFALAINKDQGFRIDRLAYAMLAWLDRNAPKNRTDKIRAIFADHGFKPQKLGASCTQHEQCATFRCDNRPLAGCVWLDRFAQNADFCTDHSQCASKLCNVSVGQTAGKCVAAGSLDIHMACNAHQMCKSQRCDNRPGLGCVPNGDGTNGAICSDHAQCASKHCSVANGQYAGTCTATASSALGASCTTNQECISGICHGPSGNRCVANRNGKTGEFCTDHAQCLSALCVVQAGKNSGTCAASALPLGASCSTHQQCAPGLCHPESGYVCVANRNGKRGDFCTDHAQCSSGRCNVAGGQKTGTCN